MQIRTKLFYWPVCYLLSLACNQIGTLPTILLPPPTSYRVVSVELLVAGIPQTIHGAFVTPQFIKAARARPSLGRYFADDEHRQSDGQVVVLSDKLWRERFGGDPVVVGAKIELNRRSYTVVGVMPKTFNFPEGVQVWLPDGEVRQAR